MQQTVLGTTLFGDQCILSGQEMDWDSMPLESKLIRSRSSPAALYLTSSFLLRRSAKILSLGSGPWLCCAMFVAHRSRELRVL